MLADFAPTAGGAPARDLTDILLGLRAATGVGAALLASDTLQDWVEAMRDQRVDEAGTRLGVDLTTVEGRLMYDRSQPIPIACNQSFANCKAFSLTPGHTELLSIQFPLP